MSRKASGVARTLRRALCILSHSRREHIVVPASAVCGFACSPREESLFNSVARARAVSGLFGAAAPAPATGGLFGAPAPAGGLFGAPAPAAAAGGGLFGAPAPAAAAGGG
eukprot:2601016-Pleurochrysis_carterae.AAC.1